jgi:hypothetical protein
MWTTQAGTPFPAGTGSGVEMEGQCSVLPGDLVGAFAVRALGRFDLLASLAAEDADEASHGVLLPARGFQDLGQRRAAPLARFIMAITSAFLLARFAFSLVAGFSARPTFFGGLALFRGRTFALRQRSTRFQRRGFLGIDCVGAHRFSLTGLRSSHRSLRFGEIATRILSRLDSWAVQSTGYLFYRPDKTSADARNYRSIDGRHPSKEG